MEVLCRRVHTSRFPAREAPPGVQPRDTLTAGDEAPVPRAKRTGRGITSRFWRLARVWQPEGRQAV